MVVGVVSGRIVPEGFDEGTMEGQGFAGVWQMVSGGVGGGLLLPLLPLLLL